jgi:hypothetical protein
MCRSTDTPVTNGHQPLPAEPPEQILESNFE